ncbi:hypothetical protein C2S51_004913 [Perilla frutescens var. frutescens]|nr:hypothetical protein C2S51_004913 [Perilla frutescens var. frutescens]
MCDDSVGLSSSGVSGSRPKSSCIHLALGVCNKQLHLPLPYAMELQHECTPEEKFAAIGAVNDSK